MNRIKGIFQSHSVFSWLVDSTLLSYDWETLLFSLLWLCHFLYKASVLPWKRKGHEGLHVFRDQACEQHTWFLTHIFLARIQSHARKVTPKSSCRRHSCSPWPSCLCHSCLLFSFIPSPFLCNLSFLLLQCRTWQCSPSVETLRKLLKIYTICQILWILNYVNLKSVI